MKKNLFVNLFIFSLFLSGCMHAEMTQKSQTGTTIEIPAKLTLIEAITLAYSDAVEWDKEATLIDATSINNDKGIAEFDGKSKYWNITFGIPGAVETLLVSIDDGKINKHEITDEDVPPLAMDYFITDLSEIKFDSPELLKKAISTTKLYPSDTWEKGYSYGISKDIEKDIALTEIIGWDDEREEMKKLQFNASTGELLQ